MKLVDYLAQLNTFDSSWGLYVNPANVDDYRIGQRIFENGGLLDDKVFADTLDNVSFADQSYSVAISCYIARCNNEIEYKGRKVKVNTEGILNAYHLYLLDKEFEDFLMCKAEEIHAEWAREDAERYVEQLRERLSN